MRTPLSEKIGNFFWRGAYPYRRVMSTSLRAGLLRQCSNSSNHSKRFERIKQLQRCNALSPRSCRVVVAFQLAKEILNRLLKTPRSPFEYLRANGEELKSFNIFRSCCGSRSTFSSLLVNARVAREPLGTTPSSYFDPAYDGHAPRQKNCQQKNGKAHQPCRRRRANEMGAYPGQ